MLDLELGSWKATLLMEKQVFRLWLLFVPVVSRSIKIGYTVGSSNGKKGPWNLSPAANPVIGTHIEIGYDGTDGGKQPIAMVQRYLKSLPFEKHVELYEDYFVNNKGGSCFGK